MWIMCGRSDGDGEAHNPASEDAACESPRCLRFFDAEIWRARNLCNRVRISNVWQAGHLSAMVVRKGW